MATARSLRQAVGSVADPSKRTRPVVTGHRALAALAVLSRLHYDGSNLKETACQWAIRP